MYETDYIQHGELSQRYQSGVKWFYWIAALTLITSVIGLLGGGWRFFLSLGTTQLIDAIANAASQELGNATKVIAVVLDIFITAVFAGLAFLASKKHLWAYLVGVIVFLFDGLLSLAISDWLGVIVHAIVLVIMVRGYMAGRNLVALERTMAQATAQAAAQPAAEPAAQPTY